VVGRELGFLAFIRSLLTRTSSISEIALAIRIDDSRTSALERSCILRDAAIANCTFWSFTVLREKGRNAAGMWEAERPAPSMRGEAPAGQIKITGRADRLSVNFRAPAGQLGLLTAVLTERSQNVMRRQERKRQ